MNFAQRLLMANENAVTNIADLWVAAAINADNDNPFESDDEYDEDEDEIDAEEALETTPLDDDDIFGTPSAARHNRFSRRVNTNATFNTTHRPSMASVRPSTFGGSPRRPSSLRRPATLHRNSSSQLRLGADSADELPHRRVSNTVPSIFQHVGVRTPPAVLEAQQQLAEAEAEEEMDALAPIAESQQASRGASPAGPPLDGTNEKEPSLMSQLPIQIILQYGWLALHSTTHDQVFYLYLVS